jgi:hypothetical protein
MTLLFLQSIRRPAKRLPNCLSEHLLQTCDVGLDRGLGWFRGLCEGIWILAERQAAGIVGEGAVHKSRCCRDVMTGYSDMQPVILSVKLECVWAKPSGNDVDSSGNGLIQMRWDYGMPQVQRYFLTS